MKKYNAITVVFNPVRGEMEVLLCSVYANSAAEARKTPDVWERGEKRIVRLAE